MNDYKKKVLVLCTGNSCRSQMAHGFLNFFGKNEIAVFSAGLEKHGLNPNAVLVMQEVGIDISSHQSTHLDEYANDNFDFVITVCDHANETCPIVFNAASKIHRSFGDPAKATGSLEEKLNSFRIIRDDIGLFCKNFVEKTLRIY